MCNNLVTVYTVTVTFSKHSLTVKGVIICTQNTLNLCVCWFVQDCHLDYVLFFPSEFPSMFNAVFC